MLVVDTQLQQALDAAAQLNQIAHWAMIAMPFLIIGISVGYVVLDTLLDRWHERVVERLKQQYPYCAEHLEEINKGVRAWTIL